ncbi:MAG: Gfo/Idh/MocA family oxidoreductase [Anaerolineae bacterium]|nr:Gfo/Idh/MocA family oxidoreductase [Anaerolineae bacterium]
MSEPIGLSLIGTGFWGRRLAQAIQRTPSVRLVNCYSRNEAKCSQFAAEFNCYPAGTLKEAFDHPDVKGVVLATPNNLHAKQTEAAAALGKHVFVEKPIADTLEDGLAMQHACRAAGVSLLVGHSFRRLGAARKAKDLIREGILGEIVLAEANFSLPGTLTPDKWRYYRESCPGGPLMQLGVHHVDTLQYLLGPITKVRGSFAKLHTQAEIDDISSTQLIFQNGAMGTLNCSYVSPKTFDLRLYGTEAVLDYHADMSIWPNASGMDAATQLRMWNKAGKESIAFDTIDMLEEEFAEFADCISGKAQPETDADQAIQALKIVLAAIESHNLDEWIAL